MANFKTGEISPGVHWVGVEDFNRRLFDAVIPIPYGTSYNCYLVKGQNKTALVDSVPTGFADELFGKIASLHDPANIDYVIMNHAEPDHAGAISQVLARAPGASLMLSEKAVPLARRLHGITERMVVVKDGDSVDLGGKTLRFIETPWVHWPETMFTFVPEEQALLTCDFFGAHMASDLLFEDETGDLAITQAKKYFGEIMMPLIFMAGKALEKAKACRPAVIAPSHGPVYRNPEKILNYYEKWINGPLENKAVILYVSMYGATEKLAETIRRTLSAEGVNTVPYNVLVADMAHIAGDMVDCKAVIVGAPVVVGSPHPMGSLAMTLLKYLHPRAKLAAAFGSYGWAGGAVNAIRTQLDGLGFEIVGTLEVQGTPTAEDTGAAVELAKKIAARVLEAKVPTAAS